MCSSSPRWREANSDVAPNGSGAVREVRPIACIGAARFRQRRNVDAFPSPSETPSSTEASGSDARSAAVARTVRAPSAARASSAATRCFEQRRGPRRRRGVEAGRLSLGTFFVRTKKVPRPPGRDPASADKRPQRDTANRKPHEERWASPRSTHPAQPSLAARLRPATKPKIMTRPPSSSGSGNRSQRTAATQRSCRAARP